MDVTGSMSKFIDGAIDTIRRLIKKIEMGGKSSTKKSVLFGFVGYRDH
jgi:hypothetical protein